MDLAVKHGLPISETSGKITLRSETNSKLKIIGESFCKIEVGGKDIKGRFIIVEELPYPMIIGRDMLKRGGIDLLFPEGMVSVNAKKFKMDDSRLSIKLAVDETGDESEGYEDIVGSINMVKSEEEGYVLNIVAGDFKPSDLVCIDDKELSIDQVRKMK